MDLFSIFNSGTNKNLDAKILAFINALPLEQQEGAILKGISFLLKRMSMDRILELRQEIVGKFSPSLPIISAALNLIDGHLVLRTIIPEFYPKAGYKAQTNPGANNE